MFKLFKYFKKSDWLFTALLIVIVALQVNLDLMLPDLMGDIVGFIQYNALYEEPLREILRTGGLMLLVVAGGFVCKLFSNLIASHITSKLARTLRSKIFKNVNSFSMEEMEKFSTASLITRTTNDVMQIQQTMMMLLKFGIIAPVMAISAVVRVVNSSLELSLATGVAVVALPLIIMTVFLVASPKFSVMQKKVDRLNGVTRENLTGLRVVRAYNAEDYQTEKFRDANEDLTRVNMFVNKVMCIMFPGMNLVMSGLMLTIYWLGASLINAGNLDYSTMAVFSQYSMQVLMSFLVLCMLLVVMPRANVSAKRIIEVIDTKSKIVEGERTQGEENEKGVVEFKNVSFRYPDAEEYVLHDISFKAERGQTVAFIGPTGSGKSTIVNLLPRFYDASEGQVLVDGVDVKEYREKSLNDKLGYVPQKSLLFFGSVKDNIVYGSEGKISDEKVEEALKVAQADFVFGLPEKTDYHIAQGGKNVSGGQRQRLSIARAIAKNPEIYIFDDSFSALDYKTDSALRAALKEYTKDATSIIVAQRIGTIMDADQIIVLEEGRIAGKGTHRELMQNCPLYREIAFSQLSAEELENG